MGADRHAQHHAARGERPARDPVDEVAQRLAERRPVADRRDRFEIVAAALAHRPDDAGRVARAERHADEGARFEPRVGGRAVAVGGVDRDGISTSATRRRRAVMRGLQKRERPAGAPPAFAFASATRSQALVRAVAIGRVLGVLAAAEIGRSGLLGGEGLRREAGLLVRAVAERLVRRTARRRTSSRFCPLRGPWRKAPSGR